MRKCIFCNTDMKVGYALYPWYDYVRLYIAPLGKATLLKFCWKCSKCGHSEKIEDINEI